jgi:CSLREA domain-containing protein
VRVRTARRVVGAVLAAALLAPGTAGAATFTVNTTADHSGTCDASDCTLREALDQAANSTAVQDAIVVPPGTYNLSVGQQLTLNGDVISGAGARSTIIDGGLASRVLFATSDGLTQPQVSGVTIRGGNGVGPPITGSGGGILVTNANSLGLINSTVTGNTAISDGGGIYLDGGISLFMAGSTVAGNVSSGGNGGGIYSDNESIVAAANSTISGNVAGDGAGGAIFGGGGTSLFLSNATVAGNQAPSQGGLATTSGGATLANTIIAGNSGVQCAISGSVTSNNSLSSDTSCGLTGTGDLQGVNPGLGPLANNGGPTDTRAIGPTSPANNRGGAGCQTTDQRGVARPQGAACDMGAYEYVWPTLTITTVVVNDDAGTKTPASFNVHVKAGGTDVAGSPQPGTASGRTYVLAPGTYTVSEDAIKTYRSSIAGSCAADGTVTLAEGQAKTCVITNDDKPPVVGKKINVKPTKGKVRVRLPGGKWRRMTGGEQLPRGTRVDTRKGRITMVSAYKTGGTATADFYDGIFKIWQKKKGKRPITTLRLIQKLRCSKSAKAAKSDANAAKKKKGKKKRKRKRRLWGNGKGRFRTKGKHSAATVVGTKWLVEDRCTSTLTKVKRGKVKVRDFVKHKTVTVRKGKRYVARARH